MGAQGQDAGTCRQCGKKLATDQRYCLHCYSPVTTGAARAHVELARTTATTHRPDPTVVFSPEKHEEILRRARSRKRMIATASIGLVLIIAGSITLSVISSHRRLAQRTLAREQAARRDLDLLSEALERFKADVQRYPTNEEGLMCLTRKPAALKQDNAADKGAWFGPYLDSLPEVDPWGNDYIYHTADRGRSFEVVSQGPDGNETPDSRFRVASQPATSIEPPLDN